MLNLSEKKRRLCLLFLFLTFSWNVIASPEKLVQLGVYDGEKDLTGWLLSEKLDGVRAYWDGKELWSKGQKSIIAPAWFTERLPPFELDGELWVGRQSFEKVVSIVRQKQPDERWRKVHYCVFEVPHQKGGIIQRLSILEQYLEQHPVAFLKVIPQEKIQNNLHFQRRFDEYLKLGAEGVVVRSPGVPYTIGRSDQILKVKKFQDAECRVEGYVPGKGKYKGMVGALICRTKQGMVLKVGSGLTDALRMVAPKLGQTITFKYYGVTKNNLPRFPVFLRVRTDEVLN